MASLSGQQVTYSRMVAPVRSLSGGSQAKLLRSREGDLYVVKLKGNPQGTSVLFNELIASRIANLLGVAVPEHCIAFVDESVAGQLHFENKTGRSAVPPGLHFASKVVINQTQGRIYDALPASSIYLVRNPAMFTGIALFHLLMGNADTPQFLFWRLSREKKFSVLAIDHGHCLGGPNWRLGPKVNVSDMALLQYPTSDLAFWLERLHHLRPEAIFGTFNDVPDEWECNLKARNFGIPECIESRRASLAGRIKTLLDPASGSNHQRKVEIGYEIPFCAGYPPLEPV